MPNVFQGQTLDLGVIESSAKSDEYALRLLWKLVLLSAIKDRATEIVYEPSRDALMYQVEGAWHDLVPPRTSLGPTLVGIMRDLSRPRGMRACLIRFLRGVIWRLVRSYGMDDSGFLLRVGDEFVDVEMSSTTDWSLVLRLNCEREHSDLANELLKQHLAARRERKEREGTTKQATPPAISDDSCLWVPPTLLD